MEGLKKVLVMDDEPHILKIVTYMLKRMGYIVEIAKDGSEAVEIYKRALECKEPINLMIMDLMIPGKMGGLEAFEEIMDHYKEVRKKEGMEG